MIKDLWIDGISPRRTDFTIIIPGGKYQIKGKKIYVDESTQEDIEHLAEYNDIVDIRLVAKNGDFNIPKNMYRVVRQKDGNVVMEKVRLYDCPDNNEKFLSLNIRRPYYGYFSQEFFTKYILEDNGDIEVKIKDKYNLKIFKWYLEDEILGDNWFVLDYYEHNINSEDKYNSKIYYVYKIKGKTVYLKRLTEEK